MWVGLILLTIPIIFFCFMYLRPILKLLNIDKFNLLSLSLVNLFVLSLFCLILIQKYLLSFA